MPIYEYGCKDCNHVEEIFYNKCIKDVIHPTNCPVCSSENYTQIPSRFLGDVVDGAAYNGGYKDYKSRMTPSQAADVIMGTRNPY
jgi:putative FmdB family regulatory protein